MTLFENGLAKAAVKPSKFLAFLSIEIQFSRKSDDFFSHHSIKPDDYSHVDLMSNGSAYESPCLM